MELDTLLNEVIKYALASKDGPDINVSAALPLPAEVQIDQDRVEIPSALAALQDFVTENHECICAVSGGFGTGKTVLLRRLRVMLVEQANLLPLYINLSGVSSSGIQEAVRAAIADQFRAEWTLSVDALRLALGPKWSIIILFDSLDEQLDLSTKELGRLVDTVTSYANHGFQTVVAFRPEMFEGMRDAVESFSSGLTPGRLLRSVRLASLSTGQTRQYLGTLPFLGPESAAVDTVISRLCARPIWLTIIKSLASSYNESEPITIVQFVEWLIREWSRREEKTNRPLLSGRERIILTSIVAFCLHSGYAFKHMRDGQVHRADLADFIRTILPTIQKSAPNLRQHLRWHQMSPDLTADSLAVSNLLAIDDDGYLTFSDSLFLDYYLARGLADALSGRSENSIFSERSFLEMLGLVRHEDLFGVVPIKEGIFISIFKEIASGEFKLSDVILQSVLARQLMNLRPPNDTSPAPPVRDLVYNYESGRDEDRSYQIVMRPHWPSFANLYVVSNAINLLKSQLNVVHGVDLSFLSLASSDLKDIVFHKCSFVGADLSFCDLSGTQFVECDLRFTLFHDVKGPIEIDYASRCEDVVLLGSCPVTLPQHATFHTELPDILEASRERWVRGESAVALAENERIAVAISSFAADRQPVTNQDFSSFVAENPEYGAQKHAMDIENPYYLSFLMQDGGRDLPVVYVSLIAAAAYASWRGKRLPGVAEFALYSRLAVPNISTMSTSQASSDSTADYTTLPPIQRGGDYPMNLITEWTIQIDDGLYWQTISLLRGHKMSQFPPFRRDFGRRCEYFIVGSSIQPKSANPHNSKQATWFNTDQGFRCVSDYSSVVARHLARRRTDLSPHHAAQ
jgi:hypothetical protein